ncbi:hypothetical protein B808_214 [Fructilactobacillus florum 8D]|uniref:Uncharacterized protein n=2 Tax=Fructilactobacillus florum TaxID=640331 RepID=W9EMR3_9LACO|nr:hypothetical protein [Fructilactobacillus florum]EKK20249.1 hypothetical protein B807_1059 [Fructilactobacillus florum 2F]ETO40934.1 hypothetical protein B808_214 [Fructilactobacillus florum 8D]KRM91363.1 hypothetical protein FC87_GL000874 [Fructilactobacillus florum DSM 22689 = JCM 16035]
MKTIFINKISNWILGISFVGANLLIWNLAAGSNWALSTNVTGHVMLINQLCWAIAGWIVLGKLDGRLSLIFNPIPVILAISSGFPIVLDCSFLLIAVVNIAVLMPKFQLHNYYGLICFCLVNAVLPITALNYLNNQYLDQHTILNAAILATLYFISFNLHFTNHLETRANLIAIILLAGLLLANYPIYKGVVAIAILLGSYGFQIFTNRESWILGFLLYLCLSLIIFN